MCLDIDNKHVQCTICIFTICNIHIQMYIKMFYRTFPNNTFLSLQNEDFEISITPFSSSSSFKA